MPRIIFESYNFDPNLTSYKEACGAHAVIFNPETNKFLVFEEISNIYAWSRYSLIGGKIDAGESPEEALFREFEEETGIERDLVTKIFYLGQTIQGWVFQPKNFNYKYFDDIYYLEVDSQKRDFEADGCITRWLEYKEFKDNFDSLLKFILENHKNLMKTN